MAGILPAHGASHVRGGADAIKLDDLGQPDDNADLNANTLRHGLCPKLSGSGGDVLAGDGTFVAGGSGITELTGDGTAGPGSGSQAFTLADTAVTPGSYTNADITVGADGRLTAAANGSGAAGGFHGVKAYHNTTQSISVSGAVLDLNSEDYDTDGYHSTTSRITIPTGLDGYYRLTAFIHTVVTSGYIYLSFFKNGSGAGRVGGTVVYAGGSGGTSLLTATLPLVAGDYVEAFAATSTTGNIGHASNQDQQTVFSAELVGT